jgi:hypothetical protein
LVRLSTHTFLFSFGVIWVWLVLNSYLGRSSGALPKGLTWVGIVAGGAFVLVIVGFLLDGQQHPLAADLIFT